MRSYSRLAAASIALLGATGAALTIGAGNPAQPACTVTTDDDLLRRGSRESSGVRMMKPEACAQEIEK